MAITKIEVPELFDFGSDNSAFKLPTGTTAERPTSPSNGEMRFNTTTGYVEYYDTTDTRWWEIDYEALCTTNDPNYPITNLAYYKMSDASDSSGNGYNGTATNVNFNVAGEFGNAGEFNGSSSYISIPNSAGNNISTFSISFWFKTNGQAGTGTLFNNGGADSTQTGWYIVILSSGVLRFVTSQGGNQPNSDGTTNYADNSWHNVVLVYTAVGVGTSTYNVYVDGNSTPEITGSNGRFTTTATQPLTIGRFARVAIEFFNGSIDQVRIFNSALNASQVTQLYEEIQCVPTIVPSENFNTVLYTGDGNATRNITGVGFETDFTWIKKRAPGTSNHLLNNTVIGIGTGKSLYTNTTGVAGSVDQYGYFSAFDIDGFTTQKGSHVTYGNDSVNENNNTYVAWNWKAGGAAVTIAANTVGNTIASDVSANVDAGFSIVKYTGNSTQGATVGHGLSSAPEMVIAKKTSVSGTNWAVYHTGMTPAPQYMWLNSTAAQATATNIWSNTAPTSTVFSIGTSSNINTNNDAYIAYCFHSVDGFSKIGSYVGTGASSNTIVTGFKPAFVMIKQSSATRNWYIVDNKRNPSNPANKLLIPNLSSSEYAGAGNVYADLLSNGFEITSSAGDAVNQSGQTYIFMAFAADPT
tara:strand:- start:7 stop:1920 length:1914 start_codon:yes stop_codon:yes gene_type:complete